MEEDFISVGLLNYADYNYKTALENFSKALSKNNDNSEALLYRGICHLKLGNYESSINDLNKAQGLSKQSFDICYYRGLAYLYNSEVSYAKTDFEEARKQADDNQLKMVNKYIEKLTN